MSPKIGKAVKAVGKTVAKTKVVRTVIGGKVIETPVEEVEEQTDEIEETPKAKRGRPKKEAKAEAEPEPATEACGLKPPTE